MSSTEQAAATWTIINVVQSGLGEASNSSAVCGCC